MEKRTEMQTTDKMEAMNQSLASNIVVPETPIPASKGLIEEAEEPQVERPIIQPSISPPLPELPLVQTPRPKVTRARRISKQDTERVAELQELCRQLCISLFFRSHSPIRSLGITSSIEGEGKSFLALVTARVLANDSINPVILVECNWEHPVLHEHFGIPATPGLAEWIRGTCNVKDICYQVERNLTVIPAGDGSQDAVKLLKRVQQHGLLKLFGLSNVIVDLPPIITTPYGTLAAGLLESIVVVVRSQVTPDTMVVETCARLKEVPIHGIILNQEESRIPHWIRQLL